MFQSILREPLEIGKPLTFEDCPVKSLSRRPIALLRDHKVGTPSAANKRMIYRHRMFRWAISEDRGQANPVDGAERLQRPKKGFHTWTMFKKGDAPHVNNIELGRRGRWRSNLWTYPGASSSGSDARSGLQDHPTVKPTAMLEDALLDLSNRGDIVLDPFLGSGSTLIAADRSGRVCRGVEFDPLYVDVIIRRYEAATGEAAVLAETREPFADLAARRAAEAMPSSS